MKAKIPENKTKKLEIELNWTSINKSRVQINRLPPLKSRPKGCLSAKCPPNAAFVSDTFGVLSPVSSTLSYNPLHVGKLLDGAFKCPHQFVKSGNIR